jgi:hypothetical protein
MAVPQSGSPYRALAVATGELHVCAILDDHKLKCWGENDAGQLGLGDPRNVIGSVAGEMGDALPPVDLGTGRTAQAVAAAVNGTCAILDDGSVKCWGMGAYTASGRMVGNAPGDMGDQLAPLDFGGRRAKLISMQLSACAVMTDGTVWCWGNGGPPAQAKALPAGKTITALAEYSASRWIVLFDDGTIGFLSGLGATSSFSSQSPQDNLMRPISVPVGRKAIGISGIDNVYGRDGCLVLDDGTATCSTGGNAVTANIAAIGIWALGPNAVLTFDGTVHGGGCGCPRLGTDVVPLGQRAVALTSGGGGFGCALLADGGIKCWGDVAPVLPHLTVGYSQTDAGAAPDPWPDVDLGTHP